MNLEQQINNDLISDMIHVHGGSEFWPFEIKHNKDLKHLGL